MAAGNFMEGARGAASRRTAAGAGQKKGCKAEGTAMVPARFLAGTPEYAKGVVGHWGRMIPFEDPRPFFI